ncbi:PAS domain-containing protein [Iodobacter sp. HSC-16F04]|uniref:histidine kinase n=1 Tax=Iodobacter violaceini TaxID=3044271 RepID=A0ABX0KX01_9NEIS|nr:ATP-binding protein [Iodobacter violacea]NHQ87193.1 PAS domain-containing protein [Iodobacter violacea]
MPNSSSAFHTEMHWRSLALLNAFRLLSNIGIFCSVLWLAYKPLNDVSSWYSFLALAGVDSFLALLFALGIRHRRPGFEIQLSIQVATDVLFIVGLMHLFGGLRSGIGTLLLPYLAAAGLISRGRMTLFHAAMASIALLSEQTWQIWQGNASASDYLPPALLCVASFAVAWLAHRLARFAQASEALAEQRGVDLANLGQLNQRILQDVSDGVLVVDANGVIRQCNEQAIRLAGMRPEGVLLHAMPVIAVALARWRSNPSESPNLITTALTRKTLRPRFISLSNNSHGNVLIYLEDLDKLRREAQQLKLAALGRLTANLAHEIRNPLSAITHAAQLLGEEAEDNALIRRLTRIIDDNGQRLERMVKDVLELNRRDRVQMTQIKLADWLAVFIEQFSMQEEIHVELALECPAHAEIRFDPGHLHQVMWNLSRNGWRYCEKRAGSLSFKVWRENEHWVLDVRNDGPPVAADAQTQLFEPFFTTETKGTGLGLYIAREICAANGSVLEYVASPETGTCFRIVFGYTYGQKNLI